MNKLPHDIDRVTIEMAALIIGLNEAFEDHIKTNGYSEFGGGVGYYETLFQTALTFCIWADGNVDYNKLGECWSYYCRDNVAPVLAEFLLELPDDMEDFSDSDALTVAERLKLPLCDSHG